MPERDGSPAGVPAWIDSRQPDVDAALASYAGLFGWDFDERTPSDSDERYTVSTLEGRTVAGIASQMPGLPPSPAWTTYIAVDGADDAAARVRRAGGAVVAEPADRMGLARTAICTDPEGAFFGLWEPGSV